tara:strand:- start:3633 stop:4400 length:768 start_codon:yes stop_codon:yes gene_type:complete
MLKFKVSFFILIFFITQTLVSQNVEISGIVESNNNIENIHVINKTAQVFTVTNSKGEFTISASLNDSLMFTSVQHKTKNVIIDATIFSAKTVTVKLEELVNQLDEVTVGKILTGDLNSDINNTEGDPPINFYDVGIPGYTGKIATQSERRLNEATTGGGIIPLNPILNAISGRTKMLKQQVKLEEKDNLLRQIKTSLSEDFFSIYKLDEMLRVDFFYFCEEDPNFNLRCKNKGDIEIFEFLKEKLIQYKENLTKD